MAKKKKKLSANLGIAPAALLLPQQLAQPGASATLLGPAPGGPEAEPGDAIGVGGDGAAPIPEEEGSFLEMWWPVLAALAAGATAFFWWDLAWYWAAAVALGVYVAIRVGLMFLGG